MAAGFDGVFPEMLKNCGPLVRLWLSKFYTNILNSGQVPAIFKKAKVTAVLKPGKDGTDAAHFRPISLLCVPYKVLERLLLNRIQPVIDEHTPKEQAGFRQNRGCTEQVLALTTFIESGFQKQMKTHVAFVDLTAAFDTVWREALLMKLIKIIPCLKIINLLNNILSNRFFRVFLGDECSRWRRISSGLPQGSVLSPTLFNLYISDIPELKSKKFIFADDLCLAHQCKSFEEGELVLSADLETIGEYYTNWRLQPNPEKSEVSSFHLNSKEASKQLNVNFQGVRLNHNFVPKYLGVDLDRSLTYNEFLTKRAGKMRTRNSIVQSLAGTSWGANANLF